MKIAGVIAEYNPFHSGHAYHLAQTRLRTGCDYVVVCMAGSYTQRGEAACLSKWDRARMALLCGADAVFELPALFAVRTADVFARAGVFLLDGVGADMLSYGSEAGESDLPERIANLRLCEPESVAHATRQNLACGMSHARAWGAAAARHLGVDEALLNAPNVILAAEYIRAIRELGSSMSTISVPRLGGYHDVKPSEGAFASATAIRAALSEGRLSDALAHVPPKACEILAAAETMHAPDDLLLHRLRAMTTEEVLRLPDVAEGLERRLLRCAAEASDRESLLDLLKCKRYTRARLSRLLAHALLGLNTELAARHPLPEYARLIGMRNDARPLLSELKKRARLPIVSDPVRISSNEIFRLECRATDLRALQCSRPASRRAHQDFTQKFLRVGDESNPRSNSGMPR